MSTQIDRLTAEQNRVWTRMQDIRDAAEREGRDLTDEERSNWDAAEARLTEIRTDVERFERMARLEAVERSIPAPREAEAPKPEVDYRETFLTFARRGMGHLTSEQRSQLVSNAAEVRAAATSPGSGGGFLIPTDTLNRITETMKAYGGILGVANVINTATGNPVNWPSNDDTSNVGAIVGEGADLGTSGGADLVFGQKTLGAYTYSSKVVKANLQLIQDSMFDFEGFLTRKLGERLGRAVAAHLAQGTGTSQPEGLFTNATSALTTATGAAITYGELVDLTHSIDPAYRTNARFVMSDSSLAVIRKMVDSQNRPLWEPNVQAGDPGRILGYPVTVDNNAPAFALSAKSVGFGDIHTAYVVRQVAGGQLLRLEERYADFLQVGFIAFLRLDAKVDDSSAFRVLTQKAS